MLIRCEFNLWVAESSSLDRDRAGKFGGYQQTLTLEARHRHWIEANFVAIEDFFSLYNAPTGLESTVFR